MQGSIAVQPIPAIMESAMFRQKLFNFTSVSSPSLGINNNNSLSILKSSVKMEGGGVRPIARCLFGSPDPVQVKSLVKEVELKNAISFGKRYNFDIVNGTPFPSKKRKVEVNDSDEENVEEGEGGYVWVEEAPATTSQNQQLLERLGDNANETESEAGGEAEMKRSQTRIVKYTKHILKQAVMMKKPKNNKITDFLKMKRVRSLTNAKGGIGKGKSSEV